MSDVEMRPDGAVTCYVCGRTRVSAPRRDADFQNATSPSSRASTDNRRRFERGTVFGEELLYSAAGL